MATKKATTKKAAAKPAAKKPAAAPAPKAAPPAPKAAPPAPLKGNKNTRGKEPTVDELLDTSAVKEPVKEPANARKKAVVEAIDKVLAQPATQPTVNVNGPRKLVKEAACRASCGGTVTLYDLGADKSPRWLLEHQPSGKQLTVQKKRMGRKTLVLAAKGQVAELLPEGVTPAAPGAPAPRQRKRKASEDAAPQGKAAPAPETLDEDYGKPSEAAPGIKVPSLWVTYGRRYGILVYYGRTRAKMVIGYNGVTVLKLGTDQLMADDAAIKAAIQAMPEGRRGEAGMEPGLHWTPAVRRSDTDKTPYTVEHFANILLKGTAAISPGARAFLDQIMGAADDLLISTPDDAEDLLS